MSARGRSQGRGRGGGGRGRGNGSMTDRSRGQGRIYTNDEEDGEFNAHLSERFGSRTPRYTNRYTDSKSRVMADPAIQQYIRKQDQILEEAEPEDWLSVPEIPPPSELCVAAGVSIPLPRNRVDQPWPKGEKYLKAHYKLLREDTVAPLREAIQRFRQHPDRLDDRDIKIYEQVRVVGLTFTYKGIASRIRFSTARCGKKILWSASKRLKSGTLVVLTPEDDCFNSKCLTAIVAARPLVNLELDAPEIDIIFAESSSHEVDPQVRYIMVEANQGYFEYYRHTLRALQKQSKESFPLSEHICQLNPDVPPPDYLLQNPRIDISTIDAKDEISSESLSDIDVVHNWPSNVSKTLDKTQWKALQKMLTQKLAIIQGPPGTGKTHVSNIALQIMLRNRQLDDPPIIIACQTNHALDQLLTFIKDYEERFIRLGGRSTDSEIRKRALYEVRKAESMEDLQGSVFSKARRDIITETMKCKSILAAITEDGESEPQVITADMMHHLGVIGPKQHDSLVKGASQWIRASGVTEEPLQMWLGTNVTPYRAVYNQQNFGFEEADEDLEMEQRRELDADMGVADDEDHELLKGDFISLAMGHTTQKPTPQTIDMAKRSLESATDLYKIPEYLRGASYMVMQEKARMIVRTRLQEAARTYDKITTQIQIGRWEKDLVYLAKAPIIGMTTTGLSKYRALISALKPKIMLIEEAAEVLEAPVGVGCVESLQHLILVGDHQQLQANCSVRELQGEPYHLNISMFERLFINNMPTQTLLRQRRMEPLFRQLIQVPYPALIDHPHVTTRPRTEWGMGDKICWFLKHDKHELTDETLSAFNEYEAEMVVKFYRHLMRNDVKAQDIAVLTFYNGQRKKILKLLKSDPETASVYNKVKTVDSYQGEESRIVLLSLTRSNAQGNIGFLKIDNRVIVALSRAKMGFYLFGNGDFLAEHSQLWDDVETKLFNKGLSSEKIPTTCIKHGKTIWIEHPAQFDLLNGGCELKCNFTLSCGHPCTMTCHGTEHHLVNCEFICNKRLVCGHSCQLTCKENCECQCDEFFAQQEEKQPNDNTLAWQAAARLGLTEERPSQVPQIQLQIGSVQTPDDLVAGQSLGKPKPQSTGQSIKTNLENGSQPVQRTSRALGNGRTRYVDTYERVAEPEPAPAEKQVIKSEEVAEQFKQLNIIKPERTSTGWNPQNDQSSNDRSGGWAQSTPASNLKESSGSQRGGWGETAPTHGGGQTRQRNQPSRQPRGPPAWDGPGSSNSWSTTRNSGNGGQVDAKIEEPSVNQSAELSWDKPEETHSNVFDDWSKPEDRAWEVEKRKELDEAGTSYW